MSDDEEEEPTRRSTRETRPTARLEPRLIGQSYNQLEYCHNLIHQTEPDPSMNKEYTASDAMLMGRLIDDLNSKITVEGASFAQQYLPVLNKGIKVFGETPLVRLETRNFRPYVSQPSKTIEKQIPKIFYRGTSRQYWPSGGLRFFTQNQML
jgi:hypothetical protein